MSPRRDARTARLFWLITIVAGAFAHVAGMKFVVPGNAAKAARHSHSIVLGGLLEIS
jgi:hypothetical protein